MRRQEWPLIDPALLFFSCMDINGYAYKCMNWLILCNSYRRSCIQKLKRGSKGHQENIGVKVRIYLLQWKEHLARVWRPACFLLSCRLPCDTEKVSWLLWDLLSSYNVVCFTFLNSSGYWTEGLWWALMDNAWLICLRSKKQLKNNFIIIITIIIILWMKFLKILISQVILHIVIKTWFKKNK